MFSWVLSLFSLLSVTPLGLKLGLGTRLSSRVLDKAIATPAVYRLPRSADSMEKNELDLSDLDLRGNRAPVPLGYGALVIVVSGSEQFAGEVADTVHHLQKRPTEYTGIITTVVVDERRVEKQLKGIYNAVEGCTRVLLVTICQSAVTKPTMAVTVGRRLNLDTLSSSHFPGLHVAPNSETLNYVCMHIARTSSDSARDSGTVLAGETARGLARLTRKLLRTAIVEGLTFSVPDPVTFTPKCIHYLSSLVAMQEHRSEHGHRHYLIATNNGQAREYIPIGLWVVTALLVVHTHILGGTDRLSCYLSTMVLCMCAPISPLLLVRLTPLYVCINESLCRYCRRVQVVVIALIVATIAGSTLLSTLVSPALKLDVYTYIMYLMHIAYMYLEDPNVFQRLKPLEILTSVSQHSPLKVYLRKVEVFVASHVSPVILRKHT